MHQADIVSCFEVVVYGPKVYVATQRIILKHVLERIVGGGLLNRDNSKGPGLVDLMQVGRNDGIPCICHECAGER